MGPFVEPILKLKGKYIFVKSGQKEHLLVWIFFILLVLALLGFNIWFPILVDVLNKKIS